MTKSLVSPKAGERIHKTVPAEEGQTLVSDGHSRWERVDNQWYLVVDKDYKDPEESPEA